MFNVELGIVSCFWLLPELDVPCCDVKDQLSRIKRLVLCQPSQSTCQIDLNSSQLKGLKDGTLRLLVFPELNELIAGFSQQKNHACFEALVQGQPGPVLLYVALIVL